MKFNYLLMLIVASMSACASETGVKCISNETAHIKNSVSLLVIPDKLHKGGKFRLFFPKTDFDHPSNFAIKNPDGVYFVVIDDSVVGAAMSSDKFKACQIVEVDTSILKGVIWEKDGKQLLKDVFDSFGKYELYFADNLETEASNTFSITVELELISEK